MEHIFLQANLAKVIKQKFAQFRIWFLGSLSVFVLILLNSTVRWKRLGRASDPDLLAREAGPKIVVFWHGCQLFMAIAARDALKSASGIVPPRMSTLVSAHGDGRIIAYATKLLGLDSVSGSSTRGGRLAISNLIACLQNGSHICITPDGPKGPRHVAKEGAVAIASKTGVSIWPSACAASSKWQFGSWDKMFLPKPFSTVSIFFGEPLLVPKDLDEAGIAKYVRELEGSLAEAIQAVGGS